MGWFTGFVLYVLIWWMTLFAVLPFGNRPVVDPRATPGGWTGHPEKPHLMQKAVATTVVASVIFLVAFAIIHSGWISFRSGWWALPDD